MKNIEHDDQNINKIELNKRKSPYGPLESAPLGFKHGTYLYWAFNTLGKSNFNKDQRLTCARQ